MIVLGIGSNLKSDFGNRFMNIDIAISLLYDICIYIYVLINKYRIRNHFGSSSRPSPDFGLRSEPSAQHARHGQDGQGGENLQEGAQAEELQGHHDVYGAGDQTAWDL